MCAELLRLHQAANSQRFQGFSAPERKGDPAASRVASLPPEKYITKDPLY